MLTYEQAEYIRKQYLQFIKGKISLEKINNRLQKYFKTNNDFSHIIKECQKYNKGYFDITFEIN